MFRPSKSLKLGILLMLFGGGGGGSAPVTIIQDSFTDVNGTDIDAHTPDLDTPGGGWVTGEPANIIEIASNELEWQGAGGVNREAAIATGLLDLYDVQMELRQLAPATTLGVGVRCAAAGTGTGVYLLVSNAGISLLSTASGPFGSNFADVPVVGNLYRIELSGNTINGYLNGTLRVTGVTADYAADGSAGIRGNGGNGLLTIDNFVVRDLS